MAETNTPTPDISQQATAPTPKKKPATAKNPKRVAASKMVAERTWWAREAQKKACPLVLASTNTKRHKPQAMKPILFNRNWFLSDF